MATGMTVTGGGSLNADYVVHINAQGTNQGWKKMIVDALIEAEKRQLESISFPALGTGTNLFLPSNYKSRFSSNDR